MWEAEVPPEREVLMAVERRVVVEKKGRKTPINQYSPSHPVTVSEATARPPDVGALQKQVAAFDPRLLPTKLSAGKSSQEYVAEESVFTQGDAAGLSTGRLPC
jgi:hypothetical protein